MKIFFICGCLLLFGCKKISYESTVLEQEIPSKNKISIDYFDENSVLKFSDIYDTIQFVELETLNESLIGRIDKIIATENEYIILDIAIAKKVFVFDKSGKFLNKIGENGIGPEEYDSPDDIAYDKYNEELLVLCHNRKTIMKFKLDGTFLKNIKIDWWVSSIYVVDNSTYLLYLNNFVQKGGKRNNYNIIIIDGNGKVTSELFPYNKEKIALSPPSLNIFRTFQQELLFSPRYSNRIFNIYIDSAKIQSKYHFDFGKYNIPQSLFNHVITKKEFDKAIFKDGDYAYNIAFAETSSHVLNLFAHKRNIYTSIYSKESGIIKYSSIFFNDINSLASGGIFCTQKGDTLISLVEPSVFVQLQSLVKDIKKNPDNISNILLKQINTPLLSFLKKELTNNYSKAIASSNFTLSDEEINFINSVNEEDNPILMIATLKKF